MWNLDNQGKNISGSGKYKVLMSCAYVFDKIDEVCVAGEIEIATEQNYLILELKTGLTMSM